MRENIPARDKVPFDEVELMEDEMLEDSDDEFPHINFFDDEDTESSDSEFFRDETEEEGLVPINVAELEQSVEIVDGEGNAEAAEKPVEDDTVSTFGFHRPLVGNRYPNRKLVVTVVNSQALWNTENSQIVQCTTPHSDGLPDFYFTIGNNFLTIGNSAGRSSVFEMSPLILNQSNNFAFMNWLRRLYTSNPLFTGDVTGNANSFRMSNDGANYSTGGIQRCVAGAIKNDDKDSLVPYANMMKMLDTETYKVICVVANADSIQTGIGNYVDSTVYVIGSFAGKVLLIITNGRTGSAQATEPIESHSQN